MGKEKIIQCHICGTTFNRKDHLLRHIEEKHEDFSESFNCPECGDNFQRADHLIRHTQSSHTGEKRYKCEVCEKSLGGKIIYLDISRLSMEKENINVPYVTRNMAEKIISIDT